MYGLPHSPCRVLSRMGSLRALAVTLALTCTVPDAVSAGVRVPELQTDAVTALLRRLEQVIQRADAPAFLALLAGSADRDRALGFASVELMPGVTKSVVQERDRQPLTGIGPDNGYRLILDVFAEYGSRGRISTWRVDLQRVRAATAAGELDEWRIADEERVNVIESLYRIALDPGKQYDAHDLKISAEDLDLTLTDGSVFVSGIDQGVTGLVLMGHGEVRFHPAPPMERGQVKIFSGAETLESRFDTAFVRLNPADFDALVPRHQLTARPVDPRDLRRADEVFREESPKSFGLDLGDLSREAWSLLPSSGDVLAEIHTRRFDTLTYARSGAEAEDITVFDRKHHHNIALYASAQKIARRGPFYNEDDLADYDILDYDIDLAVTPDREWLDGRARVLLKVKSYSMAAISLHLADPLVVQSIVSDQFGRLFGIRVKNQNTLVVNLPSLVPRDTLLGLTIVYAGRLAPQVADREAVAPGGPAQDSAPVRVGTDFAGMPAEPSFLYSSRSYWYPQGAMSDYATATLRISVPAALDCVASGELAVGSPTLEPAKDPAQSRKRYVFRATQPLRYLALIVSRFVRADTVTIAFDRTGAPDDRALPAFVGTTYDSLHVSVEANPRQVQRGHEVAGRAVDIAQYYAALVGDSPYSSFTVALVESDLPGGHSPGYFAALNQPLRARASVVGPSGRLAQLSRAVAERRVRAVLRRALRAASAGRRDVHRRAAAAPPLGPGRQRRGADLSRLPPGPHPRRKPDVPRAGVQQRGGGAAHAAPAGRRRGVLPRAAPLLPVRALSQDGHGGLPARDGTGNRPDACALLRSLDLRIDAAESDVQLPRGRHRRRAARRADRRSVRPARDHYPAVRLREAGRRRRPGHRSIG